MLFDGWFSKYIKLLWIGNIYKKVCLTCVTLHMLKQLIVVTFSQKSTIIYLKV